jgi:hypothetical protein
MKVNRGPILNFSNLHLNPAQSLILTMRIVNLLHDKITSSLSWHSGVAGLYVNLSFAGKLCT